MDQAEGGSEARGHHVCASGGPDLRLACAAFQSNLGQSIGGKYCAKTKQAKVYSEQEVAQAVERVVALQASTSEKPHSGLAQVEGGETAGRIVLGRLDGGDESSDDVEELEPSEAGCDETLPGRPLLGFGNAGCGESAILVESTPRPECPAVVSSPGASERSAAQRQPCQSRSRSGQRSLRRGTATSDLEGDSQLSDSNAKARIKSASHWMHLLTVSGAFSGKKYVREVQWAQDCIDRATRAGQGMSPEALLPNKRTRAHTR